MTYQEAVTYLRMYGAKIDEDSRKTNQVKKEELLLNYEETLEALKSIIKTLGLEGAYKELRDNPKLKETLKIDPEVWNMLRIEFKVKIRRIRDQKKSS